MWNATAASRFARRLTRRSASRTERIAADEYGAAELTLRRRWGSTPLASSSAAWVEKVVEQRLANDPQVDALHHEADERYRDLQLLLHRQAEEARTTRRQYALNRAAMGLQTDATHEQTVIEIKQIQNELETIDALSATDAARLPHQRTGGGRSDKRVPTPTRSTELAADQPMIPPAPLSREPRYTGRGI